jgi:hypothetical protein
MNDDSLDREIESLLAVEPSPEFVARVRTRVAAEPEPGGWRVSWMLASAAAIAAVVVAVIAWPKPEVASSPERQVAQSPRSAAAVETSSPRASFTPPEPQRQQPSSTRVAAVARLDRAKDIDLPEIVIADNEVKAYTALVASIRQHRFGAAVPEETNPDTPLEIKELPPVEPLEIEPIVKLAARHAEGELP